MCRFARLFAPILTALAAGCGPPEMPVVVTFEARHGEQSLRCGEPGDGLQLTDLRFFVHDPVLRRADGTTVPVALDVVSGWQSRDVALVDLEDGSGSCANGTPERRAGVAGRVPAGDYRGLEFTLGVPAALNHGNPLTAAPPLTNSAMHWHWRSGYKFLRAGFAAGADGAWLHLGSARCHGVSGDLRGCDRPNRVRVGLPGFEPGRAIVVDLAALFAGSNLDDRVVASCQMGPDEALCGPLLAALGIDPATGNDVAGASAAVFRVAP